MQVSSVSNFCPDTGGEGGHLFRLTCSIVLQGGRNTANKYHWHVWGVLTVSGPYWVCLCSWHVCFPGLHCSGSRLLSWELSKAGPGLRALPRSKPLKFRFLGTPQRHRFSWVCVLCPSWVSSSGNHVLGERTVPGGLCFLITSLVPAAWFPRCTVRAQT